MAKWLRLYHPRRKIVTTALDTDAARLDILRRSGWKIGPTPPEALPESFDELEGMVEAGELGMQELPKKAEPKKVKKE